MIHHPALHRALAAIAMPWNSFVAAFLYYTLLAVMALGGLSPAGPVVATAYLAPPVMYLVALLNRAGRALTTWFSELATAQRAHPAR